LRKKDLAIGFIMVFIGFLGIAVPQIMVLEGSRIIPNAIALHEERNLLYVGYSNGRIGVWNVASGQLERLVFNREEGSSIVSLTITHHRKYLASAHENGTLVIWDLDSFQQYGTLIKEDNPPWALLFSQDDQYLFTGNADGRLRMWNVDTKFLEAVFTRHRRLINSGIFSPDGSFLATGSSDHSILLWDVPSGEMIQELSGHKDWVTSLSFTGDGRFLVSASADQTVYVWSIPQGYLLRELGPFQSEVWSGGWFENRRIVVGEASGRLSIWNMETAREIRSIEEAHNGLIRNAIFSPYTKYLYTSSNDGSVRMWSSENLNLIATFLLARNGEWISYMPTGQYLSSVNALVRGDFFVRENRHEYPVDQYFGFLDRVNRLPIGDVDGPTIIPVNLMVTPSDSVLRFRIEDETLVETVSEGDQIAVIQRPRAEWNIDFDIFERQESIVTIIADDFFGNITRETFSVDLSGFRFFVKEDYEELKENSIVTLKAIESDSFLVEMGDREYLVPKTILGLSPLAPRISVSVDGLEIGPQWKTEEEKVDIRVQVEDVLGVKELALSTIHHSVIENPAKKMEFIYNLNLPFGTTPITIQATNVEQKSSKSSIQIIRWEREAPQYLLPVIPSEVYSESYTLSLRVSDNYLVDYVRAQNQIYPVQKQEAVIPISLQIHPGSNRFRIEVVDPFQNTAEVWITIQGLRRMYVQQETTAITDESGTVIGILFKGSEVLVNGQTNRTYRIAPADKHKGGYVEKDRLGMDPPDMHPPGIAELRATIVDDRIRVRGIAYDDLKIKEIWVSGVRVSRVAPVSFEVLGYPVRESLFFEMDLLIQGEELFPIEVEAIDSEGNRTKKMIQPHL